MTKGDPIAIEDIRDLRFMAEVYARQDKCKELFVLWDNPPDHLKDTMNTYRDDLINLKTKLLRRQEDWPALEAHCLFVINDTIAKLNQVQDSKSLWELCAWKWEIWDNLLRATRIVHPGDEYVLHFDRNTVLILMCLGERRRSGRLWNPVLVQSASPRTVQYACCG